MSSTIGTEITYPELFKACGINVFVTCSLEDRVSPFRYGLVLDKEGDLWIEVNAGHGHKSGRGDDVEARRARYRERMEVQIARSRNEELPYGKRDSTDVERAYRFRVCSRAMCRASPVWKRMLFGPWREGKPADGGEWVVPLPDDEPMPIAVLLAITHGRLDLMQTWHQNIRGARKAVSGILSTADKYDVVHLLRPFVNDFYLHAQLPEGLAGRDNPATLQILNIAWQLGAVNAVRAVLRRLMLEISEEDLDALRIYAEDGPSMGIPLEIWEALGAVKPGRQAAIQAVLDYFHGGPKSRYNDWKAIPTQSNEVETSAVELAADICHGFGLSNDSEMETQKPVSSGHWDCTHAVDGEFESFMDEFRQDWLDEKSVLEGGEVDQLRRRSSVLGTQFY